jgi:hypothetical protein
MAAAAWKLYAKAKQHLGNGTIKLGVGWGTILRWPFLKDRATLRPLRFQRLASVTSSS